MPCARAHVNQGVAIATVSLTLPPTVAQTPMILGGAQPEGYVYICTNQGLTVWGHADIVQASLTDPACKPCADKKDCTEGCKRDFVLPVQFRREPNPCRVSSHIDRRAESPLRFRIDTDQVKPRHQRTQTELVLQ
jgi:hypothetical protein